MKFDGNRPASHRSTVVGWKSNLHKKTAEYKTQDVYLKLCTPQFWE